MRTHAMLQLSEFDRFEKYVRQTKENEHVPNSSQIHLI